MQVPDYMHGNLQNIVSVELDGACRRAYWAVVLGLVAKRDGDQWCVLWGESMIEGVAAFGDTPEAAIHAFDAAMRETIKPVPEPEKPIPDREKPDPEPCRVECCNEDCGWEGLSSEAVKGRFNGASTLRCPKCCHLAEPSDVGEYPSNGEGQP